MTVSPPSMLHALEAVEASDREARELPRCDPVDRRWTLWMAAAQIGCDDAYRRLLEEVKPWLQVYFRRRLQAVFVDDAVQDTFCAVHEKRDTYDPSRSFRGWLAAIARHHWIDRLRSLRAIPEERDADLAIEDPAEAIVSELVLDRLLGLIKPAQSRVIRLVKLHGLSIEEAARETGQSVSLVKVNIHRGLIRLADAARTEDPRSD